MLFARGGHDDRLDPLDALRNIDDPCRFALEPHVPRRGFSRAIRTTTAASTSSIGGRRSSGGSSESANDVAMPAQDRQLLLYPEALTQERPAV